jgi:uncharacterized RDD family membrane protein YckC
MKNIEIITAQNVILQYELAGLRERALAFLLDIVVLLVSLSIISGIGTAVLSFSQTAQTVFIIFISCLFIFYSLLFEIFNKGQSIGKMALGIQVIKVAGGHATFSDYAARWVFRMVDIYFSFGAIASILVVSSSKAQRIGDVVANTAVVKLKTTMDLNLDDILTIHQKSSNYVPRYTQARKLQEEDALLIKMTLDRCRKFHNDAHEEALTLLTQKVMKLLEIENKEGDQTRFLQVVLQDYVILTR